jgi:hypothetical protein
MTSFAIPPFPSKQMFRHLSLDFTITFTALGKQIRFLLNLVHHLSRH